MLDKQQVARVVTEAGAPWVVNIATALIVGFAAGAPWWGAFAAAIAGGVPMVGIIAMQRRGQVGDHHVTDQGQRKPVVAAIVLVMVAGVVVEVLAHAPRAILFTSISGLVTIAVVAVVTIAARYKVSVHVAVWTGSAVLLAVAVAPWWVAVGAIAPLVGWSRVVLAHHSPGQVWWGGVLGVVAVAATAAVMAPI